MSSIKEAERKSRKNKISENSSSKHPYEQFTSPNKEKIVSSRECSVLSEENVKQLNQQNEQFDQQGGV